MKRHPLRLQPPAYGCLVVLLGAALFLTACTRERPSPGPGTFVPTVAGTGTPLAKSSGTATPVTGVGSRVALATLTISGAAAPTPQGTPAAATPGLTGTPEAATAGANAAAAGGTYTVQAGDTLSSIARRFGLSVTDLTGANQLADPNTLHKGQVLTIPAPGSTPSAPSTPAATATPVPTAEAGAQTPQVREHVVKAGETLYSIAKRYGVPLDKLADANNITNPSLVHVGQRLTIPSGGEANGGVRRVHVVQKGETLTSIAARYGVTPQQIRDANNLTNPKLLVVGQQLVIP